VPWGLTGSVWPQRAAETQLLFGQATVRYPAACDGTGTYPPYGSLSVYLDGEQLASGSAYFYSGAGGRAQTISLYFYPGNALLGPDSELTRVMTAKVMDSCTGTGQDFTFESLEIDIVALS
jgi:hypothetical protein